MNMPGWELVGEEERQAVNEVFDNGGVLFRHSFVAMRNNVYKVREFEKAFAEKLGRRYAHAVTSGTAALTVGLKALGIQPGDEVITQSHTFVATVEAILECGATPVISDINWTLNMDPADLEAKISPKTRAIIPVHMLGVPCQMAEIMVIARRHGLAVLEDTAQACGGSYHGTPLGTIGDVGAFSFDHGKVLTTGEGGMVLTNDEKTYLTARAYADHGHEDNPNFTRGEDTRSFPGFNYCMTELQGAIGLAQLKKLEFALMKQRENKQMIKDALKEIRAIRFRELPDPAGDTGDALVFFLERPEVAKDVASRLKKEGLGFKNLPDALDWHFSGSWDHIFTRLPGYEDRPLKQRWSQSAQILRSAIAIPIFIKMDEDGIDQTVSAIRRVLNRL
jgi:8-amino-3,8-dideoxy-alpha-D-manno-octulosonate transaminase